jgi:hypothetical protein
MRRIASSCDEAAESEGVEDTSIITFTERNPKARNGRRADTLGLYASSMPKVPVIPRTKKLGRNPKTMRNGVGRLWLLAAAPLWLWALAILISRPGLFVDLFGERG